MIEEIRVLSRSEPVVRTALLLSEYGRCDYTRSLEIMVIKLAQEKNDLFRALIKEKSENFAISSTTSYPPIA